MKEVTKLSIHSQSQKSSTHHCYDNQESRSRGRRQKHSNPVYRFSSVSDPAVGAAKAPTLSNTTLRRRTKYKRQRPKLNVLGETDLLSDKETYYHSESTFDEVVTQIAPSTSIEDDISSFYNRSPSEHLLSDHTTIDVLLLEAEMKNVLSDLEAFGISDDDYGSLALTSEEEKVEGESWPNLEPTALSKLSGSAEEVNVGDFEEAKDDENDDWEVLSDENSVWSIDTFADAKNYRDALLRESSTSKTVWNAEVLAVKMGANPPSVISNRKGVRNQLYIELLENADIWTSIRDAVRTIGAGKQSTVGGN